MGGSGGSQAGKSDFPEYMKTFHGRLLDNGGGTYPNQSVMSLFNTAIAGGSPFHAYMTPVTSMTAKDAFVETGKTFLSYSKIFKLLEDFQNYDLDAKITEFTPDNSVTSIMADVSSSLDDDIVNVILPKFQSNLRSIGAVMSSAYAIGESVIWDSKVKALAKERISIEELSMRKQELGLKMALSVADLTKQIAFASTDVVKTYLSLKTDEDTHYAQMGDHDRKFDMEMLQYCNNTLAAISGAALNQGQKKNQVGSAVGGALSGAAMGALAGAAMGPAAPLSIPMMALAGAAMGLAGGLAG